MSYILKYSKSHVKIYLLFLITLLQFSGLNAGKLNFEAGFRIPVTHSAGVEYRFNNWLSASFHANILTNPYKKAFISILGINDKNEVLANTIGEALNFGLELQPSVKYWYKDYYFSVYYSNFRLVANASSHDIIENNFQFDIPDIYYLTSEDISLRTNLNNLGISFGRLFKTQIQHLNIKTELSVSKCFASDSKLEGSSMLSSLLTQVVDDELTPYLVEFGYIPSINVYFVYNF